MTTWNPSDKSAGITLSNSNLTANGTQDFTDNGVRATTSHGTLKYYYEAVCGPNFLPFASDDVGLGFTTGSTNLSTIGASANPAIIMYADGAQWYNGSNVFNFSLGASGLDNAILAFAIDFTDARYWVRYNLGSWSNWNNSGSADPATNTGGVDVSGITFPLFPLFVANQSNTAATGRFPPTNYLSPPPSGFLPWDPPPVVPTTARSFIMG